MLESLLQSFSRAANTSDGWVIFVASKVVFFSLKIKIWEFHSMYFGCIYPLLLSLAPPGCTPSPYSTFSSFLFFPFPTQITPLDNLFCPHPHECEVILYSTFNIEDITIPLKKTDSPYSKKLSVSAMSVWGVFEPLLLWWIADWLHLVQAATAVESS